MAWGTPLSRQKFYKDLALAKRKKEIDQDTYSRQLAYAAEVRKRRVLNSLGYGSLAFLTLFLGLVFFGGERFSGLLRIFGLRAIENQEAGIYADCSREENRNIKYCRPQESEAGKTWKTIGHGKGSSKFSLYGD